MNLSSNRINQNAPRNRGGRAIPNRASAQPTPSRPQVQQANTLSNYGTTTRIRSLYPGQILKGEVTDLRNTEVVVTLENNTTVAGKLQNGSWLAIGETAAFKVASASQENIVLEALPRTDMALANSTIQKALEEAGLPKTDKNQQIVLELMNNQLPIHRQGIQQMLQLAYQHKDIQIPTLVLMNKLQIPLTETNAVQLERYINNANCITTQLQDLASDLTNLIQKTAEPYKEEDRINTISTTPENASALAANPQKQVTETIVSQEVANNGIGGTSSFQTIAARIISSICDTSTLTTSDTKTTLPDAILQLTEPEQTELVSILENFDLTETTKEAIRSGTLSLRQAIHLIRKDFEQAYTLDMENTITDAPNANTEQASKNSHAQTNAQMLRTSLFDTPLIQKIEQQFTDLQIANKELGGALNNVEQVELSQILNQFPLDEKVKDKIVTGEIPTSELMRTIKTVLPFTPEQPAAALLSSSTFSKLLKKELLNSFLLSPKELSQQGGVDFYYRKLEKHLEDLDTVLEKQLLSRQQTSDLLMNNTMQTNAKESVGQLKDNLNFMKLLNQFFSFVQLPTKMQDACTHADLYVYTRKKQLAKQQNPIHILLHLDMDYLGSMNVDVKLKNKTITANFSMSDEKAKKLLENNLSLLNDALLEKGYLCNSKVSKLEKEVDIVKDFIEPEHATHGISRYSFDLRA